MDRLMSLVPALLVALCAVSMGAPDPKESAEVLFAPSGKERAIQKRMAREIGAARKTIVGAIYQFTSKEIAQALVNARTRGVEVRLLVDGVQAANARGVWTDALQAVEAGKIPMRRVFPDGEKSKRSNDANRAKFHHKFMVIDGELVITGSYNWTVLADEENCENIVLLSSKSAAQKYAEEFERIWKDPKVSE